MPEVGIGPFRPMTTTKTHKIDELEPGIFDIRIDEAFKNTRCVFYTRVEAILAWLPISVLEIFSICESERLHVSLPK